MQSLPKGEQFKLNAELFSIHDCARICKLSNSAIMELVNSKVIRTIKRTTGETAVRAFDLIQAFQGRDGKVPSGLGSYMSRVLVIEDENEMARAIARLLERNKYIVLVTHDGFQASTVLESFSPAIIVLDLQMPNVSGMEVLEQIRGNKRYDHIKIVVVSAAPIEQLNLALESGADHCLEKPFENSDLLKLLKDIKNNHCKC